MATLIFLFRGVLPYIQKYCSIIEKKFRDQIRVEGMSKKVDSIIRLYLCSTIGRTLAETVIVAHHSLEHPAGQSRQ